MTKNLSRKDFLVSASKAAVGLTAVAGLSSLVTTATAEAKPHVTAWPWPYVQLDVEAVRIQAHSLYYNDKDCCAGTFGAITNALTTAIGDPWANLPMEIMLYGRGGGNAWGVLCGCLNGGAALISLVTTKAQSGPLISELWGWYTQADLPTTQANLVATSGGYLVHKYDLTLPQNVAGSPLCHTSVSEWCIVANKKVSDVERKERCARITGDVAAKTVDLLNKFFAGQFTATYTDPANVAACLTCHGTAALNNVQTKMDCQPCHSTAHPSKVESIGGAASGFALSQNYPNPFNPSTKIQFSIPETEKVKVAIYDIQGKLVRSLVDYELYQPGNYELNWDGRDNSGQKVTSGIYFTKMRAGKFAQTKKMNLVK
ncbi:MAG: C-GCAxxG-C-C family protein [Ignavibacteriales bacterium]|nr:C-GCAxxG-C-C family protein [Ignavibacteriales bacterium]